MRHAIRRLARRFRRSPSAAIARWGEAAKRAAGKLEVE